MKAKILVLVFISTSSLFINAQSESPYTPYAYLTWGYNKDFYSSSDIHISQPSLGNNYMFQNISGNDNVGWTKLFQNAVSIPQYNYRLGFFFRKDPSWGFELNFDHTKYQMTIGQDAHLVGTVNNRHIDTNIIIADNYFHWKLNNGANFFLFNLMKRYHFMSAWNDRVKSFVVFKGGVGFLVPHVENTLMGIQNNAHFQLGGWDAGLEASYRVEIMNYVYLDLAQKVDYARYFGLSVYQGTASQSFWAYEVIATLGIMIPLKVKTSVQ